MSFRVRIRNFQSIEDATVEVDGLTAVIGPNNSGKTSTMRAIRGVFTNTLGSSFVRHGTTHATVDISFPDGQTVIWEKGENVNRYTVNGKVYDKVGRGVVPDEVLALGVKCIQAGAHTLWPQIASQFTGQVFLLDQSGSAVAEAIADVERVGKLTRALKASESDRRAATTTLKVRRKDADVLLNELVTFDGIDTVAHQVDGVESVFQQARQMRANIDVLIGLQSRVASCRILLQRLAGIGDVREVFPDSETAEQTRMNISELVKLQIRLIRLRSAEHHWTAAIAAVHDFDADFGGTAVLQAQKIHKGLTALYGLRDRIKYGHGDVARLKVDLLARGVDLDSAQQRIRDLLGDRGECPICGSGMSHDH